MKKLLGTLLANLILFLMAGWVSAQVSSVSILGVAPSGGGTLPVTFVVHDDGQWGTVHYDILFSAASSPTTAAYSSYLRGNMVCAGTDTGYTFNDQGGMATTIVKSVAVPSYSYSGNLMVLAVETSSQPFVQCSSAYAVTTFTVFTPTPTLTSTFTITPTGTFTWTPTATSTYTSTKTSTSTPTQTPVYSYTSTQTFTPTFTPTFTQTRTPVNTNTITPTLTFTKTPTFTSTSSSTLTPTSTPTVTPTMTITPTATNGIVYVQPAVVSAQGASLTSTGTAFTYGSNQGCTKWSLLINGVGGSGGITVQAYPGIGPSGPFSNTAAISLVGAGNTNAMTWVSGLEAPWMAVSVSGAGAGTTFNVYGQAGN